MSRRTTKQRRAARRRRPLGFLYVTWGEYRAKLSSYYGGRWVDHVAPTNALLKKLRGA